MKKNTFANQTNPNPQLILINKDEKNGRLGKTPTCRPANLISTYNKENYFKEFSEGIRI